MNATLFDEFPILVDRVLAEKIGLNEAIVVQQLHYWINQNKRQNKNYYDGNYWTYNSFEKWHKETFYFWSEKTVKRIFKKLEDDGLIIVANYNKKGYDRTKWYSIDYEKLNAKCCNNSLGQNDPMDKDNLTQWIRTKCPDGLGQNDPMDKDNLTRPIPKTNPKTTKETTQPLVEVEKEIKAYFNLEEKDIEKVANVYLATGKEISYLVEKLKFVKNSPNTRDIVGYLIAALKNDYKPIINTYKAFIPQVKTRFHNINQSFDKYDPDELEKILKESQKGKFN